MAVAQAMITLTRADTISDFVVAVKGRIAALARAHSLLSQSQWRGAPLEQVIRDELTPLAKDGQLRLAGPPAIVTADAVQPLSLLFHELATNALKYGGLSRAEGLISVSWHLLGDRLAITWKESGGPAVQQPQRTGFGTKLIAQVAGRQLRADVRHEWRTDGLCVTLELPRELFTLGPAAAGMTETAAGDSYSAEESESTVGGNLLLLEDEELVAEALADELTKLGWRIAARVGTLPEAQALLSSSGGDIDAAVLDVNLRGRLVYPVAEELTRRGIPYIFCTGYEMVEPNSRYDPALIVRKPATGSAVSAALELALNGSKQT
jgi:two-component sensor histidine kinase/CheY-like chemotaxis protein